MKAIDLSVHDVKAIKVGPVYKCGDEGAPTYWLGIRLIHLDDTQTSVTVFVPNGKVAISTEAGEIPRRPISPLP
jgi:hypothetical protein